VLYKVASTAPEGSIYWQAVKHGVHQDPMTTMVEEARSQTKSSTVVLYNIQSLWSVCSLISGKNNQCMAIYYKLRKSCQSITHGIAAH
jgi:hypothetical protein